MSLPVTPKVWFDASDTSTLTSDTQGNVSEWRSKGSITIPTTVLATPIGSASRSLYMNSNGGFTAAFRARLTNPGLNERIIEFANGPGDQNVIIYRNGTSNTFSMLVVNVNSSVFIHTSAANSLDKDFHNWIFRMNGNTRTVQIFRDGTLSGATGGYTSDIIDRLISTVNIGRSVWAPLSDAHLEGDISALYVFDRYITDDEMATINTHMSNYTATPLPIYNAKVSLNAALLTQANNTPVAAWEDYVQSTAGNRPTFQLNPPRINFSRASSQYLVASVPVVKTARLTQNGKNSILFPPESSLRTSTLSLAGTSKRIVFAVARNLSEVNGGTRSTWSNVRYVRLERTTAVDTNIINISEIEVYDAQGRRIPHATLMPTMSTVYNDAPNLYGPQFTTDNNISLGAAYFPHTKDLAGSWIQVDLGAERTISKVIIRNRYDGAQARIKGTTLRLQRADNSTNVASIPITNAALQSLIFTPNGLFFGGTMKDQSLNLFTTPNNVTGAIIARYSGYRSLQMIPGNSGSTYNLDSYMINDTEVNVFSLVNDATIANTIRVNGYPQSMTQSTNAQAYSTTTSQYTINCTNIAEANDTLQLCELLVYDNDAALTLANVQAIEKYLYDKWIPQAAGIPVPRVWLDAADADTIQANTQNTLTNWTSKGNAYGIVGSSGAGIGAQRTFNVGSNGGFTAAFRVEFTGTVGNYERIFDFSTTTPPQSADSGNIILGRQGTTNNLAFWLMNGSTRILNEYLLIGGITSGVNNFIIRVNDITKTAQWYKNGNLERSIIYGGSITDRTFLSCFIGRSNYTGENATLSGNLRALYMFDRAITDEEITVIHNHMLAGTATQLPIYNPIVSLNAALINAAAGATLAAWEDFTSTNSPTFQTSPARILFNGSGLSSSGQYFTEGNPIIKTGRLQQYGKNTIYLPPQSALQTAVALTGSTTSRSVFAVARNLTEICGGTITPWANVRYVRLERTSGTDPLNINEIEVYDGTGKRIPVNTLTATLSSQNGTVADYGPQLAIDNTISTGIAGYAHTLSGASEFIQVDLGTEKSVSKVIIRNRYANFQSRLAGTTLYLRRANGTTNVATQVIAVGLDSTIITPGGIYGAKYTQNNLFANTTVTGALNADITDYKTLSMNPQGSANNVDTTLMVDDTQPNVFAIINDATVGNTARINATTQILRTTATNAYTNTAATYITNYNAAAEANSALQLCELLVYDTALTAQQVIDIQTYLIQKWQYAIATPMPDPAPFITSPGAVTYWWEFSDLTKLSTVTLALTGGPGATTVTTPALNYQHTFNELTDGIPYFCTILATGEDGQISGSSSYSPALPGGMASAPRNATFTYMLDGRLSGRWEEPISDGGSPIVWYVLRNQDFTFVSGIEGFKRDHAVYYGSIAPQPGSLVMQAINAAGYGEIAVVDVLIETPLP